MAELNTVVQLRNDVTSEWEKVKDTKVLETGEVGIEFLESGKKAIKIGDGESTWGELDYFASANPANVYQVTLGENELDIDGIERVVNGAELQSGDLAIVISGIAGDASAYTSYVYTGTEWIATEGNYSADNVYFKEDITVTAPVGTITQDTIDKGNGSATLSAEGKTVSQVLGALLAEAKDPSVDLPSVSFSVNGGSGEVGTSYTLPTATLKVTDVGSYTYGSKDANNVKYGASDTGVVFAAGDMTVTFGDNTVTNESDLTTNGSISVKATDDETLYTDDTKKYKFSASAEYTESDRIPLNNLGNKVDSKKITSDSISIDDKEVSFSGWRKMFMGTVTDASAAITSDVIRGLTLVSEQVSKSAKTFTVPVGATKIIVAFPKSFTSNTPKFEYFTMSWEDFSGFEVVGTVEVADARGGENGLKEYTVYAFTHSSPSGFEAATQYRVTLK